MKIDKFKPVRRPQLNQDARLKEAAQMYEKHFLRELVKSMRSTVSEEGGVIQANQAEKIFREQLDDQYVEKWSGEGGIGLADLIEQQIRERLMAAPQARPHGPLPADASQVYKIEQAKGSKPEGTGSGVE